jgi:phosphoglycolate phosphatase
MGMLLPDILHRLVPELDQERMKPILEEVLSEENAYVAAHGGVLYPEVEQTLAALSARCPLFLVSNCQDGYIEAFFQAHGLGRYFTDYENPGRTGLPKADNIALVAERNGLRRPLYIGDTQGDYDAASKAGVPFLHAAYGFGRIDRPVPSVATFGDLPDAICRLTPP